MIDRFIEQFADVLTSQNDIRLSTDERLLRIEKRLTVVCYFVIFLTTVRIIGFVIGIITGAISVIMSEIH